MSTEASHVIAYTAFPNRVEAVAMARSAVQKQLAAGADVREVTSLRPAGGEVEERAEYIVALQTATPMIEALKAHVLAGHSQQLPAFVVVPITAGYDKFLAWIDDYVNEGATAASVGRNGSIPLSG